MHNVMLFFAVFTISLILSSFNIISFKNGTLNSNLMKKNFTPYETTLMIALLGVLFFISTLKAQTDAIFLATVIYLLPFAAIKSIIYRRNKDKNELYGAIIFLVVAILCGALLVLEFIKI